MSSLFLLPLSVSKIPKDEYTIVDMNAPENYIQDAGPSKDLNFSITKLKVIKM